MDRAAIIELAEGIQEILGEKIAKIVLYGSVARGTDTEESDVDVALLMINFKNGSRFYRFIET